MTAVVQGRWKLINSHDNLELYDTRADPSEHDNVAAQHPREVESLRKLLDAHREAGAVSTFR
jgi:arylsulfatase A-like enzyme